MRYNFLIESFFWKSKNKEEILKIEKSIDSHQRMIKSFSVVLDYYKRLLNRAMKNDVAGMVKESIIHFRDDGNDYGDEYVSRMKKELKNGNFIIYVYPNIGIPNVLDYRGSSCKSFTLKKNDPNNIKFCRLIVNRIHHAIIDTEQSLVEYKQKLSELKK